MRLLPYGDRALLAELDSPAGVLALAAALDGVPGIGAAVPGARTLLVPFDPARLDPAAAAEVVRSASGDAAAPPASDEVEIAVRYDGEDLADVAREAGCSVEEVVARHTGVTYTVAFCGFSPGFAYLVGLHPSLQLPRLASPRTAVPAGSVAIAGEFTGVYPRSSPGGWRLLGRTDVTVWDVDRTPPALLTPGTRVRFSAA